MDCQRCTALIDDVLDESVDSELLKSFNGHIARCPDCRARFESDLTIQNAAPGLLEEPPEELLANVMYRLGEGKRSGRRFVFGRFTALAAAAAVVMMAVYFGDFLPVQSDENSYMSMMSGGQGAQDSVNADSASSDGSTGGMDNAGVMEGSKLTLPLTDQIESVPGEKRDGTGGVMAPGAAADSPKTTSQNQPGKEWIEPAEQVDVSGMSLVWRNENFMFTGDPDAVLSLYTSALQAEDGSFIFDDGQDWALVMSTEMGEYPLFSRRFVQLGAVSCVAYNDLSGDTEISHVLVTVSGTASYAIYDCMYDPERGAFEVVPVYSVSNINYMGGSASAVP